MLKQFNVLSYRAWTFYITNGHTFGSCESNVSLIQNYETEDEFELGSVFFSFFLFSFDINACVSTQ